MTDKERQKTIEQIKREQRQAAYKKSSRLHAVAAIFFILFLVWTLGSVVHSFVYMFTHIHETRMEMLFSPENHSMLKVVISACLYSISMFFSKLAGGVV